MLEIVSAYERAALLLLKSGVKAANHPTCKAIVAELEATCSKYQRRASKA